MYIFAAVVGIAAAAALVLFIVDLLIDVLARKVTERQADVILTSLVQALARQPAAKAERERAARTAAGLRYAAAMDPERETDPVIREELLGKA